ncbi:MAG: DUF2794 domain-containing protein [Beijerinckiaceae bacterium]|nr:DUF2794 domain-containing protein [Beijerinckiaceae bacterium]
MIESDGSGGRGGASEGASNVAPFPAAFQDKALPERVAFTKDELQTVLNLYGRMVASGEWRDYAMDFLKDKAVFSIFRRASEVPIYRIEKNPRLAAKQGAFSVIAATGLVMRRGNDLARVIGVLDKKIKLVTG